MAKQRAPRNKTLTLSGPERELYKSKLYYPPPGEIKIQDILNRTICSDIFAVLDRLPSSFADLLIIDPPYNQNKDFHGFRFSQGDDASYLAYLRSWFPGLIKVLKPTGSVYLCGDWKSSLPLYQIMQEYTQVRNRITWQREKGRGARENWKNVTEDIWFGTMGNQYYFDVEAVKQKRVVRAPYKENGSPKDWAATKEGNFRLTHPGNFWDDISISYWSMPENTDHPTQKPEKLLAKLILASCPPQGIVFDPFLGSGTSSVTAKKLGRQYAGVEQNEEYCCWAEKRIHRSEENNIIQGYTQGVFWERNTAHLQKKKKSSLSDTECS